MFLLGFIAGLAAAAVMAWWFFVVDDGGKWIVDPWWAESEDRWLWLRKRRLEDEQEGRRVF